VYINYRTPIPADIWEGPIRQRLTLLAPKSDNSVDKDGTKRPRGVLRCEEAPTRLQGARLCTTRRSAQGELLSAFGRSVIGALPHRTSARDIVGAPADLIFWLLADLGKTSWVGGLRGSRVIQICIGNICWVLLRVP
jgi:hypothetical protein